METSLRTPWSPTSEIELYSDHLRFHLVPSQRPLALSALIDSAFEICARKSMLGALCQVHHAAGTADLDASFAIAAERWIGSQRRLAIVPATEAARGLCRNAALGAAENGIDARAFDDEKAALEWILGPSAPGR